MSNLICGKFAVDGNYNSTYDNEEGEGWWNGGISSATNEVFSGGGGSSYISGHSGCSTNSSYKFKDTSMSANVRTGNGYAKLEVLADTNVYSTFADDITFFDTAKPNKPSNGTFYASGSNLVISWKDNGDNGNKYYHKVQSYNAADNSLMRTSNIMEDYLESGIKGFYYYIDTNTSGIVTTSNSTFVSSNQVTVPRKSTVTYMHVASIDHSGNLSATYTFELPLSVFINYDKNNETVNKYGYNVSTTATGNITIQEVTVDTTTNIKKNITSGSDTAYAKTGYKFVNWNTKVDGSGILFELGQQVTYTYLFNDIGQTITLYAQWEPIKYDVVFHGNQNFNTSQGTYRQTLTFDKQENLINNKFNRTAPYTWSGSQIKTSYTFLGWGLTNRQTAVDFVDGQQVLNLRNIEGDYNLYAIWRRPLKLTFNLNGGNYMTSITHSN